MVKLQANEIIAGIGGKLLSGDPNTFFTGVSTDSRTCRPGDLFIPLKGENFDGHDFIEKALEKGSAGCLTQQAINLPNAVVILVEDTQKALGRLAGFHRQKYKGPLIGVTGSSGKTTTKDMIACILSQRWYTLKTQGNYNNEIGLPLTLLKLGPETEAAVVEFGMRNTGQIRELATIARPTAAVLTNVGEAHLEILGSREAIAEAKGELIEAITSDGLVVLNGDDPYLPGQAHRTRGKVVYYGVNGPAKKSGYYAEKIETNGQEQFFTLKTPRGDARIKIPVPGRHNVYNAMAAAAICLELGQSLEEVKSGLAMFTPGEKRLNIAYYNDIVVIDDTYNANPASTNAALQVLYEFPGKRKIAILGDMLELGNMAVEGHRQVGQRAARLGIDVYSFGTLSKEIYNVSVLERGPEHARHFPSKEEIIKFIQATQQPGDVYLVKGSRGMKMEEIAKALRGDEQ